MCSSRSNYISQYNDDAREVSLKSVVKATYRLHQHNAFILRRRNERDTKTSFCTERRTQVSKSKTVFEMYFRITRMSLRMYSRDGHSRWVSGFNIDLCVTKDLLRVTGGWPESFPNASCSTRVARESLTCNSECGQMLQLLTRAVSDTQERRCAESVANFSSAPEAVRFIAFRVDDQLYKL